MRLRFLQLKILYRMTVVLLLAVSVAIAVNSNGTSAFAQDKEIRSIAAGTPKSSVPDRESNSSVNGVRADDLKSAETVIEFARTHHPELAALLVQLRSARSPEFERALRQLSPEIQRLDRSLEKTPQRYESDLLAWKIESQTRLLLARWAMSKDPELEKQIRGLLKQRREIRIQLLSSEQRRLQERLATISNQIAVANEQLDQQVDDEWQRLVRRTGAAQKSANSRKVK